MQSSLPGKERLVANAQDLAPDTYRRLVAQRVRRRLNRAEPPITDARRTEALEADVANLEKVNGRADFLPVAYLATGVTMSRAVCRITVGNGYGTGFLVGRGLVMTNNHVIGTPEQGAAAVAEFDYEDGRTAIVVKLRPDRLFLTDAALDFTVIGCDDEAVADVRPVPLRRNPAGVMPNEYVAIIQHPNAERKQIALHDSDVVAVKDKVIHYRTDTLPGSSGSPVFNNEWELVALHHAGWEEPGGRATNEGVRIGSIIGRLRQMQFGGFESTGDLAEALRAADVENPFLGFFGTAGLPVPAGAAAAAAAGGLEIELPPDQWAGSTKFADVGFWNIEHFNGSVGDDRVGRVADVLQAMVMDVMGLSEVEEPALERLVGAMAERGMSYAYKVADSTGRQDVAVLYDEETTSVRVRADLLKKYRADLDRKTAAGKTAFPRTPLIAECTVGERDASGAAKFILIAVHLKAMPDAQSVARRKLAAEVLLKMTTEIRESTGLPVVLGGDFNDKLSSGTFDRLSDSPDLVTLTSNDDAAGAISFVGPRYKSLLDHVVVSKDAVLGDIQSDDAAIIRWDWAVSDFASNVSDHVPVVMRLVYRQQELAMAPLTNLGLSAAGADVPAASNGGTGGYKTDRGGHRSRTHQHQ